MHSGFGTSVVLAPVALVLIGVALDRAGLSVVGIALTIVGSLAFLAMLCFVGWRG